MSAMKDATIKVIRSDTAVSVGVFVDNTRVGGLTLPPDQWDNFGTVEHTAEGPVLIVRLLAVEA